MERKGNLRKSVYALSESEVGQLLLTFRRHCRFPTVDCRYGTCDPFFVKGQVIRGRSH